MVAAGFPPGSEFLWDFHYRVYWDLTQRIYREELDPTYDGAAEAGTPFCAPGTPACDADYDYAARPGAVRAAVAPDRADRPDPAAADHPARHARQRCCRSPRTPTCTRGWCATGSRGRLFRYYRIEGGNHVDGLYDAYPGPAAPDPAVLPQRLHRPGGLGRRGGSRRRPATRWPARPSGDLANTCALT